jgi:hypothetical protein
MVPDVMTGNVSPGAYLKGILASVCSFTRLIRSCTVASNQDNRHIKKDLLVLTRGKSFGLQLPNDAHLGTTQVFIGLSMLYSSSLNPMWWPSRPTVCR